MLGNLIGGFIVIIVGVSLMPSLADQIYVATHNVSGGGSNNVTGAATKIEEYVPIITPKEIAKKKSLIASPPKST